MRYPECGHHFLADEAIMPKRCPTCHPGQAGVGIKVKKPRPDLEGMLAAQLQELGIFGYERQHRFHKKRKWPLDFAWPDVKLAVEIHGGTYVPIQNRGKQEAGAHSRGARQRKDFEKWTAAATLGWFILHFDTIDVRKRIALQRVIKALGKLCPSRVAHID